jgi:hypothetical protein
MNLSDFEFEEILIEKTTWGRSGKKVVRKIRCASGPRKGKLVKSAADCNKTRNIKKSMTLKKTKARKGSRMARKANRTKRVSHMSKKIRRMNRRSK